MAKSDKIEKIKSPLTFAVLGLVAVLSLALALWWALYANVAARVNGQVISKKAYEQNYEAQKKYLVEYQKEELNDEKEATVKEEVLDQLIEDSVLIQEAKTRSLEVTSQEIDDEFSKIAEANGGEEKFVEQISQYFGFSKEQYKEYRVKPLLYRDKLETAVLGDDNYSKDAKEKAGNALKEIQDGVKFSEVASKYSDDEVTKAQGGDAGWVGRGTTVKEYEDAVFALKKGEVSKVVKAVNGYYILKATDIASGKVRVSQILVQVDSFQDWLDKKVSEAKVKKYI